MKTKRILLVVTSADRMAQSPDNTGSWLEEVTAPYYAFRDARYDVTIASPKGGQAPLDSTSLLPENETASTRRYDADAKARQALAETQVLGEVDLSEYDAIFFAGGHGTMEDFPTDASVKKAIEYFYQRNLPVSAVCHGPACFVSAQKKDGRPMIEGHAFTSFTDEEERIIGYEHAVPFLLESKLRELGGIVNGFTPFESNVVVDGHVVTGQNPASSIPVAEAVIHQLRLSAAARNAA